LPGHPHPVKTGESMVSQGVPSKRGVDKAMQEVTDLKGTKETVENILASYETRIENLSSVFEVSQSLIDCLPESLLGNNPEKEKINSQLRDLLAKNDSLRKKDYDKIMASVLSFQEECAEEVKDLIREYFTEERSVAIVLKEALRECKEAIARGEIEKIRHVQSALKTIFTKQEKQKSEIVSRLREFQGEQKEIPRQLTDLVAKGENLRIKDFRLMISKIKSQRVERISLQKKRKEEVAKMLQDFGKQRQKLAFSPKTIDIDEAKIDKKQNNQVS